MYSNLHQDSIYNEPKCNLPKSYRLKVAEMFPGVLKYSGLTPKEYSAKIVWESKTRDKRARITD